MFLSVSSGIGRFECVFLSVFFREFGENALVSSGVHESFFWSLLSVFLEKNALVSLGVHELFFLVSFESVFLSVSAFLLFFFPRACVFGSFFQFGDVYSVFFSSCVCFRSVFRVWRRLFCFFPRACFFGSFFEYRDASVLIIVSTKLL